MKLYNKFLTASAILAIAGVATSCSNTEDDLFDQSAAVRMDLARTETKALLVSAENGWELSYFANNDWESGHVILMKFYNDESVEMCGANAWVANAFNSTEEYAPQRETSLYQMISDDGPVLTFNTFNKVLHIFSEPYNLPSASYNPNNVPFPVGPTTTNSFGNTTDANEAGYGHNGDYEFVVLSRTDDEIQLRGKKTGVKMRMRRLAADQDWDDYFAKLTKIINNTFSTRFGDLKIAVGGHNIHLSNLDTGVMTLLADDDDELLETVSIPFIYTLDGISLREAYTGYEDRLADVSFQHFTFNADGTLSCVERDVEFQLNSSLPEIFGMSSFAWDFNGSDGAGNVKTLYDNFVAEVAATSTYNGLNALYFNYSAINQKYALTIRVKRTSSLGSLYGTYEFGDDNKIKFSFTGTEGDSNGLSRLKKLPTLQTLIDYVSSKEWQMSTESPMAPELIKFTNTADSGDYFYAKMR
jgi:hypothetical protein